MPLGTLLSAQLGSAQLGAAQLGQYLRLSAAPPVPGSSARGRGFVWFQQPTELAQRLIHFYLPGEKQDAPK